MSFRHPKILKSLLFMLLASAIAVFAIRSFMYPQRALSFSKGHEILGARLVHMMKSWSEKEKEPTWPSSIATFAKEADLPNSGSDRLMLEYKNQERFLCLFWTSSTAHAWLFPAAGKPIAKSSQLVLASPIPFESEEKWFSSEPLRVVVFSDGTAKTVTESEFQRLLKAH